MSDVSKTNTELIDEGREATTCRCVDAPEQECGTHGDATAKLVGALADALFDTLATRVPVQGEPNDDREALTLADELEESMKQKEWVPALQGIRAASLLRQLATTSRAVVPDAATELLEIARRDASRFEDEAVDAMAERDAATAAVERVKNVLTSWEGDEAAGLLPPDACLILSGVLAALDGAPEPEWEWGCRSSSHTPLNANVRTFYFLEDAQSHARDCQSPAIVRRRKAGPWEVCSE